MEISRDCEACGKKNVTTKPKIKVTKFITVMFVKEENFTRIIEQGPWFINESYLFVQFQAPNFLASKATQNCSVIWVQLPQLPMGFYNATIL